MGRRPKRPKPVIGKDFIRGPDGRGHWTREYLLSLGSCCGNRCRYCPYDANMRAAGGGNPNDNGAAQTVDGQRA